MSIVYPLLLVFLWFSYHACHARSFGISTTQESHHSISKENEKLYPSRVSTSTPNSGATRDTAKDHRFEKEKVNIDDHNSESNHEQETRIEDDEAKDDEVEGSVAWRVPHKKGGEPEAGFNLDYLPPKTHPPVHN